MFALEAKAADQRRDGSPCSLVAPEKEDRFKEHEMFCPQESFSVAPVGTS